MKDVVAPSSPAGFWKRYVAYSIDLVLVYFVMEIVGQIFLPGMETGDVQQVQSILTALQNQQPLTPEQTDLLTHATGMVMKLVVFSSVAYAVIAGMYFALLESSPWQATLGKRMVGIKVVGPDGGRIDRGRAFGRFFAAGLSWLTMNIGHAMAAFTAERRALHDYIADTRVENADPSQPRMPVWGWMIIGAQGLLLAVLIVGTMAAVVASINAANQI